MAEPWIRYKEQGLINPYPEQKPLPYSQGLDPLFGLMETVDYLTTAPIRGGISQAQKTGKPWEFFKGAYNSLRHPKSTPTASQIAKQSGLSDTPLYQNSGRVSFGGLGSKLSPADIGGFIGENILDPSNLIPAGKAMAMGGLALGGLKKVGKEVGEEIAEKGLKNSLGRPVHHTLEGQENFKKWFNGSKVADEKGQPIVVYHGTKHDIKEFKPSQEGRLGPGIYTTTSPEEANNYASWRSEGGRGANIMPAYINIKNPTRAKLVTKEGGGEFIEHNGRLDKAEDFQADELSDGIILEDARAGRTHYIPFNPEQIKSATGNSGKFNPKDPNILKGLAPVGPWMLYQQNRQERTQNDNRE